MSFKRKSIILVLFLIAGISSALTFAYWSSEVNSGVKTASGTIEVGQGQKTLTEVVVVDQTGGTLVPEKFAYPEQGTVGEVVLTFPVKWVSENQNAASGAVGHLVANVDKVEIDGAVTNADLVEYKVDYTAGQEVIADGEPVNVHVTFTLHEPANKEEYEQIANKAIVATIKFEVTPNE